ncbi:MAG: hypothetical protein K0S40_418 [Actinomycetospora sp.]|nr:hypothetical protein [Actinomycetospora sp.]
MTSAPPSDPPPCEPAADVPAPDPFPPGGPAAVAAGCRCSVLANAAYRCGAAAEPLLDPACPLEHG